MNELLVIAVGAALILNVISMPSLRIKEYAEFDGILDNSLNISVHKYLGIPYAEKPSRFEMAKKLVPKNTRIIARKLGPACMQQEKMNTSIQMSEDCLNLNIFIPVLKKWPPLDKLPVMVYIHGGDFNSGSGGEYSGVQLAAKNNVIVVTFNYRLGVFGFLAAGHHHPGNVGLMDMQLAIMWVHEYIESFYGDPDKITLFGSRSGGTSALLLAVSEANKDRRLSSRFISQNGPLFVHNYSADEAQLSYERLSKDISCNFTKNADQSKKDMEMISCLQNAKASQILAVIKKEKLTFGPVSNGKFIPKELEKKLNDPSSALSHQFGSVNLLIGTNGKNFNEHHQRFHDQYNQSKLTEKEQKDVITKFLHQHSPTVMKSDVIEKYLKLYKGSSASDRFEKVKEMFDDAQLITPISANAKTHQLSAKSKTYQYFFDHRFNHSSVKDDHFADVILDETVAVFGSYPKGEKLPQKDQDISTLVMKYWTNFAKSGNPNTPVTVPEWMETKGDRPVFLEISDGDTKSEMGLYRDEFTQAWMEVLGVSSKMSEQPHKKSNHDDMDEICRKKSISKYLWIRAEEVDSIIIGISVALAVFLIATALLGMFLSSTCKKLNSLQDSFRLLSSSKSSSKSENSPNYENITYDEDSAIY